LEDWESIFGDEVMAAALIASFIAMSCRSEAIAAGATPSTRRLIN
jgi:hypothetical protein